MKTMTAKYPGKCDEITIESKCTVVVPSNIQAMITAVKMAKVFPSGIVQLLYVNGESESAMLTAEQLTAGRDEWFSLVSAVQSARGPSTR